MKNGLMELDEFLEYISTYEYEHQRRLSEVTNARIDISSVNSQGLKLGVAELTEQYARKPLNIGKIKIGWVVSKV